MRDFCCPDLAPPVEYLVIQSHTTHAETGMIPRSCAEAAGVALSKGTTFFTREQSATLRSHKHWVRPLPPAESGDPS